MQNLRVLTAIQKQPHLPHPRWRIVHEAGPRTRDRTIVTMNTNRSRGRQSMSWTVLLPRCRLSEVHTMISRWPHHRGSQEKELHDYHAPHLVQLRHASKNATPYPATRQTRSGHKEYLVTSPSCGIGNLIRYPLHYNRKLNPLINHNNCP